MESSRKFREPCFLLVASTAVHRWSNPLPRLLLLSGTGNVIPKTIVHLYNLSRKALTSGNPKDFEAALAVQDIVSQADWIIVKAVSTLLSSPLSCISTILPSTFSPTRLNLSRPQTDSVSLSLSPSALCQGIAGTKYALTKFFSSGGLDLGGYVRSPLPQVTEATKKMVDEGMLESIALENSLP